MSDRGLTIRPITFKEASEYVNAYHRHHSSSQGCKFCLSCYDGDKLVGVAICGRPVSRYLDDGYTLEVNRLCTDGTRNACSKLYGASVRVAKEMGYTKVITYILESEPGTSLKAAGFEYDGVRGGDSLDRKTEQGSEHTERDEEKIRENYREEVIK